MKSRMVLSLGLILLSTSALAADRVGSIVIKDKHSSGLCLLPVAGCSPYHPGVIRGLVDLLGEQKALELGFKKRVLTRRTYRVPVVTSDEICAETKAWIKQYRKDGRPKLWNWDRARTFELTPATLDAIKATGKDYYIGLNGVFIGDQDLWEGGSEPVLSVRPDLVKSIRGLCK